MWPSNAQNLNNINNITSKQIQIDQTKNTIHEQVPIYQTPIKPLDQIINNNKDHKAFNNLLKVINSSYENIICPKISVKYNISKVKL